MSRRPVDQLAAAIKPAGRQRIWDVMREIASAGVSLTRREIAARTGIPFATIKTYFRGLTAAGYIEEVCRVRGECRYRMVVLQREAPQVDRHGAASGCQGRAQEQMWQTMRRLSGPFTAREMALFATTDQVAVSEAHAVDYCRRLTRAGYLRRRAGKEATYLFRRAADTGPLPPMIQTTKAVWDQNLGRIVWPVGEALP